MIIGGRTRNGDTTQSTRYNVKDSSYIYGPSIINKRVLSKVFRTDAALFILGGAKCKVQVEVYHEGKFQEYDTNWDALFGKRDLIEYGYAQPSVILDYFDFNTIKTIEQVFGHHELELKNLVPFRSRTSPDKMRLTSNCNISLMFNDDSKPMMALMDTSSSSFQITIQDVPCPLRNFGYMALTYLTGSSIYQDHVFIGGGIYTTLKKINRNAYLMNLNTRKVKKLGKISKHRYALAAVHLDDKIYLCGGKTYGKGSTLNSCEVYDLNSFGWKAIAPMFQARFHGDL